VALATYYYSQCDGPDSYNVTYRIVAQTNKCNYRVNNVSSNFREIVDHSQWSGRILTWLFPIIYAVLCIAWWCNENLQS